MAQLTNRGNRKVSSMKRKTPSTTSSMNWSPLRNGFFLIALIVAWFALSPRAQAVCQEGCLENDNTVLGEDVLLNNTGFENTAIGFEALFSNTTGHYNAAIGAFALQSNATGCENTATGFEAL